MSRRSRPAPPRIAQREIAPAREEAAMDRQAAARAFRARFPDRLRSAWQFYGRDPIPKALRLKVKTRDGDACVYCGATDSLVIDHTWPVRLGGLTVEGNLQTLCRLCNGWKHGSVVVLVRESDSGRMYARKATVKGRVYSLIRWPTLADAA